MSARLHTSHQQGFTLIEAVITILLLAITATTIITLNSNIFKDRTDINAMQVASPLLQACAERIIGLRQTAGFSLTPTYDTACDALTGSDSFDITVTDNSSAASCPSGATCQLVQIVQKSNGQSWGPLNLQLMDY